MLTIFIFREIITITITITTTIIIIITTSLWTPKKAFEIDYIGKLTQKSQNFSWTPIVPLKKKTYNYSYFCVYMLIIFLWYIVGYIITLNKNNILKKMLNLNIYRKRTQWYIYIYICVGANWFQRYYSPGKGWAYGPIPSPKIRTYLRTIS